MEKREEAELLKVRWNYIHTGRRLYWKNTLNEEDIFTFKQNYIKLDFFYCRWGILVSSKKTG